MDALFLQAATRDGHILNTITSLQNPKVKAALKLNDRRERNQTGLFLIEGYRELKRAVEGGVGIQMVFICPELFLGSNENALIQQIQKKGGEVIPCAQHVFEKLSYRDRPDGLIAVGVQMKYPLGRLAERIADKENPFVIVAEAI